MKRGAGLFWGIMLIVIGLSIVFKGFLGVSILRIVIAVAFILIGIKIMAGKSAMNFSSKDKDVIFSDRQFKEFPTENIEYNTVFGKSVFDFSEAAIPTDKAIDLEFNTIFGDSVIILPAALPVKVKAEAIFGAAKLPNDNTAVFGSASYISDDSAVSEFVNIKVNTVFGNTEIIHKRPEF